jgi:hypothetical protein
MSVDVPYPKHFVECGKETHGDIFCYYHTVIFALKQIFRSGVVAIAIFTLIIALVFRLRKKYHSK